MAKQLVNPFERHIEKLVLGIAGLLLVGVLWKFVFSSPNKITLGGMPATPGTIDARLSQKASEILDRIGKAAPPSTQHDPKFDQFLATLQPLKPLDLPVVASLGPEMPVVDAREVIMGGAKLVKIPPPPVPHFTQGRNTLLVTSPQTGETRTPMDWVMLSFPLDVKALTELQRQTWGATLSKVIFAPPEVQRRMMKPDGGWSEDDWQTITPSPAFKMPTPPTIRLSEVSGKVLANKDDRVAADKYREEIEDPKIQLAIIRPLPPTFTKDESPWKFPIISSYENVVKMDQEFLNPTNPNAAIDDRYGGATTDTGRPKPTALTPAQLLNQKLDEARAQLDSARRLWSKNDATLAYNRALEISSEKEATPEIKSKAQKLMKEAEQLIVDITHNPSPGGRPGPRSTTSDVQAARVAMPVQEIWIYDAAPGSIVNGATYQYRVRPRVLNRLAGMPESFITPTDAQVMFVAGAWSEPTEPIHIPEASHYLLTRDEKSRREVYAEFFRWYDGVWVKSKAAPFQEGRPLVHQERVDVPGVTDRTIAEKPQVEFGEDLTLLDIEFALPVRERKSNNRLQGKFATQPTPETAAVLVDGHGKLQERMVAVDKDDPLKKDIKTWTPPKKATP